MTENMYHELFFQKYYWNTLTTSSHIKKEPEEIQRPYSKEIEAQTNVLKIPVQLSLQREKAKGQHPNRTFEKAIWQNKLSYLAWL